MLAFHGRQLSKSLAIRRVEEYYLDPYQPRQPHQHWAYAKELGVPLTLFTLAGIFNKQTSTSPAAVYLRRFISAIPVGADLTLIWANFIIWLLADPQEGMLKHAGNDSEAKALVSTKNLYFEYYQSMSDGRANSLWGELNTAAIYWQTAAHNKHGREEHIYGTVYKAITILITEATLGMLGGRHALVPETAEQVIEPVCDVVRHASELADLIAVQTRPATTFLGATTHATCIRMSEKLLELVTKANND